MYDGIQKGFEHTSGEIMAWLNSDDMYLPWTLHIVNQIFVSLPEVEWITSIRPLLWNEQGFATECMALPGFSKKGFWRGEHMPGSRGFMIEAIQQEFTSGGVLCGSAPAAHLILLLSSPEISSCGHDLSAK